MLEKINIISQISEVMDNFDLIVAIVSLIISIMVFKNQKKSNEKNEKITLLDKRNTIYQEFLFDLDRCKKYRDELSKDRHGYSYLQALASSDYEQIGVIDGVEFIFSEDIAEGIKQLYEEFTHINYEILYLNQDYVYSSIEREKLNKVIELVDNDSFKNKMFDEININNKKHKMKKEIANLSDDVIE